MIDIHSHILPAIDDGAANLDESLAMARQAVEGGTTVLFATPHVMDRKDLDRARDYPVAAAAFQRVLDEQHIPLKLAVGAEVYPMEGLLEAIQQGIPLLLGPRRKTILLDSPFSVLPIGLEQWVFKLQAYGFQVILAHPERVMPVQMNPQTLEPLVSRGMLLQVNASSFLGGSGEPAKSTAELLLRHHWVHFIASDSHSPVHRRPGLTRVLPVVTALAGVEVANELMENNGRRLLDGEPVSTDPLPFSGKHGMKRGFFSRLFQKKSDR